MTIPTEPPLDEPPVDALMLLSFGGPDAPEEVLPFLENVVRGRGVPAERLAEVAEHYYHLGGRSPINALNRALIEQVRAELAAAGWDLPVYFGNRNWQPEVTETARQMAADGIRHALVFATSAWGGYSGSTQYVEDIARAQAAAGSIQLSKIRQFFHHPLFIEAVAASLTGALGAVSAANSADVRVVFTAHSIPVAADVRSEPEPRLYSRQVAEAARLAAGCAGVAEYDLVWQSRSGPPEVPWLEPDIGEHLASLSGAGVPAVVVCPIGFLCDHVEVVWDLDTEAATQANELGLEFHRAPTAQSDPRLAAMVAELVSERVAGAPPRSLGTFARYV